MTLSAKSAILLFIMTMILISAISGAQQPDTPDIETAVEGSHTF